uniref:Thioredoxin domain-containing protein n=1 Tax=Chromera velia CCMP2878 TaxID=1169474 RepID=A0A0G4HX73_9ALVE|mmetsp:Transcript_34864/g.68832  ORF Transcript_34864/g.68832 Transcript_34864/m.68832 type:complete len:467 (-) Transcript_34864:183-1583(-)|eukprot:Cvel_9205.t1-p1 / transcript=Cvel_9205.t1 / gene=Cvel_9205 / organism=Chromera_velia_CCMP2878 / gene_product=Nucleoredoxin, putative / transcript_product=Nucleoredoxin, putative / location=Cvel_scaffold524:64911-68545(-) / protein_length=466 / sequence_SO=supercontig / SO=protein_coding / is_pseudo=false
MERVLGEHLTDRDGKLHPTAKICEPGAVLALYFSASWCPPCEAFTPKLISVYERLRQRKEKFEVVFVSSDKLEDEFKEYLQKMPWLAIPFENEEAKLRTSKKYRVSGIPKLMIVGHDGEVITSDGRRAVTKDPEGLEWPWRPPPLIDLLGPSFVKTDGSSVGSDCLKGKHLLLYFSAKWCPPCHTFGDELLAMYQTLKDQGKNAEVLYISQDKTEEDFNLYFKDMPWPALPFSEQKRTADLSARLAVSGIPTLVVLDPDSRVVNLDARDAISADPEALEFPWPPRPPQPFYELNGSADLDPLDLLPCFLALVDDLDDSVKTDTKKAFEVVGAEELDVCQAEGKDPEWGFYVAVDEGDGLTERVKQQLKVEEARAEIPKSRRLVILDLYDEAAFYDASAFCEGEEAAGSEAEGGSAAAEPSGKGGEGAVNGGHRCSLISADVLRKAKEAFKMPGRGGMPRMHVEDPS